MRLTYKQGAPEFRDSVLELLHEFAKDYHPPMNEERIQKQLGYVVRPDRAVLAFHQKEFVGYFSYRPFTSGDFSKYMFPDEQRFKGYAFISNLLIKSEFRGKGLATRLRKRGMSAIRKAGYTGMVTTVWAKNRPMLAINKRDRFRLIARCKAPWRGQGEKTLIFAKKFRRTT